MAFLDSRSGGSPDHNRYSGDRQEFQCLWLVSCRVYLQIRGSVSRKSYSLRGSCGTSSSARARLHPAWPICGALHTAVLLRPHSPVDSLSAFCPISRVIVTEVRHSGKRLYRDRTARGVCPASPASFVGHPSSSTRAGGISSRLATPPKNSGGAGGWPRRHAFHVPSPQAGEGRVRGLPHRMKELPVNSFRVATAPDHTTCVCLRGCRLRAAPANPTSPEPRSRSVQGSGTEA
jgi:hypothetical protein